MNLLLANKITTEMWICAKCNFNTYYLSFPVSLPFITLRVKVMHSPIHFRTILILNRTFAEHYINKCNKK